VENLEAAANLPHPYCPQAGIDGSPPPLLAAPVAGGGGELGPALSVVEGSLKLEFGQSTSSLWWL
jgi:hypothetical protein